MSAKPETRTYQAGDKVKMLRERGKIGTVVGARWTQLGMSYAIVPDDDMYELYTYWEDDLAAV